MERRYTFKDLVLLIDFRNANDCVCLEIGADGTTNCSDGKTVFVRNGKIDDGTVTVACDNHWGCYKTSNHGWEEASFNAWEQN